MENTSRNIPAGRFTRAVHICVLSALFCLLFLAVQAVPAAAASLDDVQEGAGYASILYTRESGLPTSEANDIEQSEDGFIWIASYGGLVRYDGKTFYRYDSSTGVSGTTCLFIDSGNRLWGGTNDKGAFMLENEEFTFFSVKDGLSSSFVHAVCGDENGNILIGSNEGIDYIDPEMQVRTVTDERIAGLHIWSLVTEDDGLIYGCSSSGSLFRMKDLEVVDFYTPEEIGISAVVESWCLDPEDPDLVYIGTASGMIYHGKFGKGTRWEVISTSTLTAIDHMEEFGGRIWICSDSGIGYLKDGKVTVLSNVEMDSAVHDVMEDYQGNLWFASTRQGVMKIVKNPFLDISQLSGMPNLVVNTTCLVGSDLYIGTDSGLYILNSRYRQKTNRLTSYLEDTRIRCIRQDSKGTIWLTTRSETGLVSYDPKTDTYSNYNTDNGVLNTNSTRVILERQDGTLAVATDAGVQILSDGKPIRSCDSSTGMEIAEILCLEEMQDGTLLMGSDGGGIYAEDEDGLKHIGLDDGLESEIILRIKKDPIDPEIFWIITSSSIAYMKDGAVTTLHHFPYSNNFDIFFSQEENPVGWVLGSSGIYMVRRDDLLADEADMTYTFLDTKCGLPCTVTANSYSFLTEDGILYIAGNQGVSRVDVNKRMNSSDPLRMSIPYLMDDDEYVWPEDSVFTVSSDCRRLTIPTYIFTYSLENPHITYCLEGFDEEPIHSTRDALSSVSYTNLAGGTYKFRLSAIDTNTDRERKTIEITIVKEKMLLEYVWFQIAMALGLVAFSALLFGWYFRRRNAAEKEQERVRAEETLAAHIQSGALPKNFPAFPDRKDFDIYAMMIPARDVGGDFYDFFLVDDDHLAMVMADVSGKGVPGALFMMKTKTLIKNRTQFMNDFSPADVLSEVNNQLCENNDVDMFVTVWMAILDLRTGEGLAANAGHENPVLRRAGGQYEMLKYRHSPALGAMEDIPVEEHEFRLEPGDTVFVYTDGVPESMNGEGKFFGTDRMLSALNDAEEDMEKTAALVKTRIDSFADGTPQFDDITMLCFRYFGPGEAGKENEKELTVPAELDNLEQVMAFIKESLEAEGCPEKEKNQILVSAEEIFVNIASYAYDTEGGTAGIRIRTGEDAGEAVLTFTDSGSPFDPLEAKTPDVSLPAEDRPIGGLGIFMVKEMMDSAAYEYRDGQNILTITKRWNGTGAEPAGS